MIIATSAHTAMGSHYTCWGGHTNPDSRTEIREEKTHFRSNQHFKTISNTTSSIWWASTQSEVSKTLPLVVTVVVCLPAKQDATNTSITATLAVILRKLKAKNAQRPRCCRNIPQWSRIIVSDITDLMIIFHDIIKNSQFPDVKLYKKKKENGHKNILNCVRCPFYAL